MSYGDECARASKTSSGGQSATWRGPKDPEAFARLSICIHGVKISSLCLRERDAANASSFQFVGKCCPGGLDEASLLDVASWLFTTKLTFFEMMGQWLESISIHLLPNACCFALPKLLLGWRLQASAQPGWHRWFREWGWGRAVQWCL